MKKSVRAILTLVVLATLSIPAYSQVAPDLGTTSGFALFTGGGAFDSEGGTHITGDIASFTVTPIITSPGVVDGTIYTVGDGALNQPFLDLGALYDNLFSRTPTYNISVTLGGQTLTPGVHSTGSGAAATLSGSLTFNANGNPNAVFIVQIDGALSVGSNTNVILTGGASACNIYWQITGAFDLGSNSIFMGTVVGGGAIELLYGATLYGRAFTKAGAIHLHNNKIVISNAPSASAGTDRTICQYESTQLGAPPVSGNTYSWTSLPAGFTSSEANPTVSPMVTTTYTLTDSSSASGCSGSNSVTVTVNPAPVTSLINHY
ncbi:MAG: ice-binding family protein [Paludibacter sp.]|jgi:hypothetical protein|nr:ice-binding family protein [Paludibacter sp.]